MEKVQNMKGASKYLTYIQSPVELKLFHVSFHNTKEKYGSYF